jgi:hypothetical protein
MNKPTIDSLDVGRFLFIDSIQFGASILASCPNFYLVGRHLTKSLNLGFNRSERPKPRRQDVLSRTIANNGPDESNSAPGFSVSNRNPLLNRLAGSCDCELRFLRSYPGNP